MYHIFFIHSSVDEHLGCFYLLAILHSATMNTGVQITLCNSVFNSFECIPVSGIYSHLYKWVGLLDHILFSIVATPFNIPTSGAQGIQFLHILAKTCYFLFFDSGHPHRCEVIAHCGFFKK